MECRLSDDFVDNTCRANRAPLQLTNLSGTAVIYGFEGRVRLSPHRSISIDAVISYARGEGDNPGTGGPKRVPLSRVPPLNGNGMVTWRSSERNLHASAVIRWATRQDRLSVSDGADARIPIGGTPGYVVSDLRFGHRVTRKQFKILRYKI